MSTDQVAFTAPNRNILRSACSEAPVAAPAVIVWRVALSVHETSISSQRVKCGLWVPCTDPENCESCHVIFTALLTACPLGTNIHLSSLLWQLTPYLLPSYRAAYHKTQQLNSCCLTLQVLMTGNLKIVAFCDVPSCSFVDE